MRSKEEILEGVYSKEVVIKGIKTVKCEIPDKILQHKQVDQIKLNLAILETLLDIREQNEKR